MNGKILALCGILSFLVYVLATIIGGALRPGYNHITNTVSELMAPGSPNKLLMHVLFTISAILGLLFGIGVLQFVLGSEHKSVLGIIGAISLVVIGVVTILTSSVFPQDPQHDWDAPPTFAGQMHKVLAMTVLPILSLLSTLTLGIWLGRTGIFPMFSTYSLITIGVTILAAILTFGTMQQPILGLTERITIIVIQQWTIVLSLKLFLR